MDSQNLVSKFENLSNIEEQHLLSLSTTKKVNKKSSTSTKTNAMETTFNEQLLQPTADKTNATKLQITESSNSTSKHLNMKTVNNFEYQDNNDHRNNVNCKDDKSLTEINSKKKVKSKRSKKSDCDKQNISVKSSFNKFDALQKSNLIHVRSSDADKAQEIFGNSQDEKQTNCRLCSKPVYKMEEIKAEKNIFHKNCFRCHNCNKPLKVDNYQSHEGTLFCLVHFKLLFAPKFVEDTEPMKPRKAELIIRENQPTELPPDVVRASDKPDLGLEELQQLNVRSRFKVFENPSQQKQKSGDSTTTKGTQSNTVVQRKTSLLTKLAKLQQHGLADSIDVDLTEYRRNDSYENNSDSESSCTNQGDDFELVRSKASTQRERPVGLGDALQDIRTKFEKGHILSKEERREERKQEIQNIRSRLFMGKQAKIKEMYQQAVADSEQCIISADRKPDVEIGAGARCIKERFEKGEMFKEKYSNADDDYTEKNSKNRTGNCGLQDESDVFESAISKKSRSIFMELDANVASDKNVNLPTPNKQQQLKQRATSSNISNTRNSGQQAEQENVVKCDEKAEDIKIATSEISEKFKFFEAYRPTECEKKTFRITPPREGVVKMPSMAEQISDIEGLPNKDNVLETSQTTSLMINKFRAMEEHKFIKPDSGPRPLKCFTPPPDDGRHMYQDHDSGDSGDSGTEETEEEFTDENDFEDDEKPIPDHLKMSTNDEALKEAQNAARAKLLRAKFEKWQANEIQKELDGCHVNVYSQDVSDDSTIETTKTIRERFENMKNTEKKSPNGPRYQVNRFV